MLEDIGLTDLINEQIDEAILGKLLNQSSVGFIISLILKF